MMFGNSARLAALALAACALLPAGSHAQAVDGGAVAPAPSASGGYERTSSPPRHETRRDYDRRGRYERDRDYRDRDYRSRDYRSRDHGDYRGRSPHADRGYYPGDYRGRDHGRHVPGWGLAIAPGYAYLPGWGAGRLGHGWAGLGGAIVYPGGWAGGFAQPYYGYRPAYAGWGLAVVPVYAPRPQAYRGWAR